MFPIFQFSASVFIYGNTSTVNLYVWSENREKQLLASSCLDWLCLSDRPTLQWEQLGTRWTYFFMKLYFWVFFFSIKIFQKIQVLLKYDIKIRVIYVGTYVHLWEYIAQFFLEWEMFQKKAVEKFRIHILCSIIPPAPPRPAPQILCPLWDNVLKYGRTTQATDDNIIRWKRIAWWLSTSTHTHTHILCNSYGFSTATMVTRTCLIFTLYVHCPTCFFFWRTWCQCHWSHDYLTLPCCLVQQWPTRSLASGNIKYMFCAKRTV